MDFTEDLILKLPDLRDRGGISGVSESHPYRQSMKESLVIEVAAIHEGITSNFNMYTRQALEESVESWYTPYPKPLIKNHDQYEEPLGRVMHAEMQLEENGLSYIKLQVAVTDPGAVEKILDGRYLTGSVGGKPTEAICSICNADWASTDLREGLPCKHKRGRTYRGSVATLEMRGITWKEYSMVNVPADDFSSIRHIADSEGHDVGLFALNMSEQEIYGISDDGVTNLLEGLRKKEARPLYMQTKGAFLSALAQSKLSIDPDEEAELDIDKKEEEDILAVVENLSDDLAAAAEESNSVEDSEEVATEEGQDNEEAEVTEEDVVEEPVAEEEAAATEATEEEEDSSEAVAQEEDLENSATAEEQVAEEEEADNAITEMDAKIEDLTEQVTALESKVEALESEKQELLDENGKLKTALKKGLAERVVDSKIALGYEESENRAALVEEHMKRSASSLADFLNDFASMTTEKKTTTSVPEVETSQVSIDEDAEVDSDVTESAIPQEEIDPEKFFNDLFMGRRSL